MARRTIVLAVGGGGALLALTGVLAVLLVGGGSKATPAPAPGAPAVEALLAGIPQHGAALGSPHAPVTLVEFADLQCSYCADWARLALPDVISRYVRTGKVRLVFRGLAFLGPDSVTALRTAVAAGRQNRLWNVVELLYANQGAENTGWVSEDLVRSVTGAVPGLSAGRVLAERATAAVTLEVQRSAAAADAAGVDSTPSFLVARSGQPFRRLEVRSLDASGIVPALDSLLAS